MAVPGSTVLSMIRQPTCALVLLVAASEDLRHGCARDLTGWGLTVATEERGASAFDVAMQLLPEIVLTELGVPGLDGKALCRALKADRRTKMVPVLAVGRLGDDTTPAQAADAGFDDLIAAPYQPSSLARRVRELIGRGRSPDAAGEIPTRARRVRRWSRAVALHGAVVESRHLPPGSPSRVRCPTCNCPLVWHERQAIAGQQFDYFRPCARGCGFFFFDQTRRQLKRLLG